MGNIQSKSISVFRNALSKSQFRIATVQEYFNWISDGANSTQVEDYRYARNERTRRARKKSTFCVTMSGVFENRTDKDMIGEHTGIIVLDLDAKDNPDIDLDSVQKNIGTNKHILAVHKSLSGEGLAIYIILGKGMKQSDYSYIRQDFEYIFDVKLDSSTSNLSRLRFLSYDPSIIINYDAEPYTAEYMGRVPKPSEKSFDREPSDRDARDLDKFIKKIEKMEFDITDGMNNWLAIGMALSKYGELGRTYFHRLSSFYKNYDYDETNSTYSRILSEAPHNVGDGFIIHKARQAYVKANKS